MLLQGGTKYGDNQASNTPSDTYGGGGSTDTYGGGSGGSGGGNVGTDTGGEGRSSDYGTGGDTTGAQLQHEGSAGVHEIVPCNTYSWIMQLCVHYGQRAAKACKGPITKHHDLCTLMPWFTGTTGGFSGGGSGGQQEGGRTDN